MAEWSNCDRDRVPASLRYLLPGLHRKILPTLALEESCQLWKWPSSLEFSSTVQFNRHSLNCTVFKVPELEAEKVGKGGIFMYPFQPWSSLRFKLVFSKILSWKISKCRKVKRNCMVSAHTAPSRFYNCILHLLCQLASYLCTFLSAHQSILLVLLLLPLQLLVSVFFWCKVSCRHQHTSSINTTVYKTLSRG